MSTTGQRGSAVERADVEAAHRSWARHALTCTKGAGMRGIVHDRIVDIVMVLLENAGFDKVKTEDLWWDAEAAYSDADHRRPDVTCVHPVTGEKLVFDVVVWWGASKGFREDGGAVAASQREAWKRRRYERAMWARYVDSPVPRLLRAGCSVRGVVELATSRSWILGSIGVGVVGPQVGKRRA